MVGGGGQITSRLLTSEVAGVLLTFISLVVLCYKDKCNVLAKHASGSSRNDSVSVNNCQISARPGTWKYEITICLHHHLRLHA